MAEKKTKQGIDKIIKSRYFIAMIKWLQKKFSRYEATAYSWITCINCKNRDVITSYSLTKGWNIFGEPYAVHIHCQFCQGRWEVPVHCWQLLSYGKYHFAVASHSEIGEEMWLCGKHLTEQLRRRGLLFWQKEQRQMLGVITPEDYTHYPEDFE